MNQSKPKTISEAIALVEKTTNSAIFITPNRNGETGAFFFGTPKYSIYLNQYSNVIEFLKAGDSYIANGFVGYSVLPYELGLMFEPKLAKLLPANVKVTPSFHFYDKTELVSELSNDLFENKSAEDHAISDFKLNMSKSEYSDAISAIEREIEEGNTYQVNYTTKGKFNFTGSPASLFERLLFNQSAPYSCFINTPNGFILSLSPELFIKIEQEKITTIPMKGTAKRGCNIIEDNKALAAFTQSKKDQTENLIIVDLLRNDLGAISEFGSVKVNSFFDVEKLESVYQMTSEITAKLNTKSLADILPAIFPCGSITGAPKCKTMEIIAHNEVEPRNIYTGSIGLILPEKILFNVVIRSALIEKDLRSGEIGLGSGIVWDSKADKEYEEICYKGDFLTKSIKPFGLIESVLIENGQPFLLERHLNRLEQSADFHLFSYNKENIWQAIKDKVEHCKLDSIYKARFILSKAGKIESTLEEIFPVTTGDAILSKRTTNSEDKFLYFKTTNRELYNSEYSKYRELGFFDVIFRNEEGFITEGAISNVMIKLNNAFYTPPLSDGLLNGVYREELIKRGSLSEKRLRLEDLQSAEEIWLINSVRKSVRITHLSIGD